LASKKKGKRKKLDLICHWMVLVHVHMPCTRTHFPIHQPSTTVVRGFLSPLHLLTARPSPTAPTNRWLMWSLKTI
jgi:hypothetical protein